MREERKDNNWHMLGLKLLIEVDLVLFLVQEWLEGIKVMVPCFVVSSDVFLLKGIDGSSHGNPEEIKSQRSNSVTQDPSRPVTHEKSIPKPATSLPMETPVVKVL